MVTSRRCPPLETRIRETRTILDYIQGNLGLVLGFDSLERDIVDSYPKIEMRYAHRVFQLQISMGFLATYDQDWLCTGGTLLLGPNLRIINSDSLSDMQLSPVASFAGRHFDLDSPRALWFKPPRPPAEGDVSFRLSCGNRVLQRWSQGMSNSLGVWTIFISN